LVRTDVNGSQQTSSVVPNVLREPSTDIASVD
jgi:hypothetical protein